MSPLIPMVIEQTSRGERSFDILFVDVQMPGMSGLDLVRLVRADAMTQPFVAIMTASATAADRRAAETAGADDFVTKPATHADITSVVRRVADLSS